MSQQAKDNQIRTDAVDGAMSAEGALEALSRLDQVMDENVGLANEVLRTYEQLSLVFEVTHEITHITDVAAIERILVGRIGRLIGADEIDVLAGSGERRHYRVESGVATPTAGRCDVSPELLRKIDDVRARRQVAVGGSARGPVIIGPMPRLDDVIDIVMAVRTNPESEFNAGDMMLVESMLSFGGKIIANCELHEKLRKMSFEVTRALVSAIDKKDNYTSGHSERVGFLARLTGEQLGLPAADLQWLEWAGILHDVGKIGIREEVLGKRGRLTEEEFAHIKEHPRMGYEILKPIAQFDPVLQGVLHHHENPDGTGYPIGLKGDDIPMFARIIHVSDVFDALSSDRSYRPAFTVEQACEIIVKDAGTKLDAEVAAAFLEALHAFRASQPQEFARLFQQGRGQ